MTCENHAIEVKNIDNGVFSREHILIAGSIKNQCENECVELHRAGHVTQETRVFQRNFKFLVRLDQSRLNLVKICYCSKQFELVLTHESINPLLYDIQPIYIIPQGQSGTPEDEQDNSTKSAVKKINLLTSLAQCVISTKASCENGRDKAFALNKSEIFRSRLSIEEVWRLNQFELYDQLAQEILERFGKDVGARRKFIGFMSCTRFLGLDENEEYSYAKMRSKTQANPSLGSGFLALLGNGCFFALPENDNQVMDAFRSKRVVDTKFQLDDSNYRKTYGGCFSTTLGSLIHEVGHLFDLSHTENGLMGNDIDHVHRFFLCENFTEIMPKRNVANCQQSMPKEDDERRAFAKKLTKINRNGAYMEKYHEQRNNDLTFFERNCQVTLMSHRWFTQKPPSTNTLSFDEIEKTVYSSNESLALIEIRELECKNSLTKKFWDLTGKHVQRFTIDCDLSNVSLFAITSEGSVLKKMFLNA